VVLDDQNARRANCRYLDSVCHRGAALAVNSGTASRVCSGTASVVCKHRFVFYTADGYQLLSRDNDVISAIFFDLGDTLGVPVLSVDHRLERFEPFQFAQPVLKELREKRMRLGVISNTGEEPGARMNEVLGECALLGFFEPTLLVYSKDAGLKKDSPKIFQHAAKAAGLAETPEQCLFVER
jgi:hypothetical protein